MILMVVDILKEPFLSYVIFYFPFTPSPADDGFKRLLCPLELKNTTRSPREMLGTEKVLWNAGH